MIVRIEVTDTFGGEAKYSWVRRYGIEVADNASRLAIVRRVKRELDLNGHPSTTEDYGDNLIIRPRGMCQMAFVDCLPLDSLQSMVRERYSSVTVCHNADEPGEWELWGIRSGSDGAPELIAASDESEALAWYAAAQN